ncbi:MAG TPA: cobalamin-binding protein [Terriglobia bacterium]|nr:cobalamin-binding protein [Terriglobia bacterium]
MLTRATRAVLLALFLFTTAANLASRELRDGMGRLVNVPDQPHRIICLAPNLTETVYALGLGNDVVGITNYTDYPPQARLKPKVGGPDNPSVETIISLHPDLIIAGGGINQEHVVEQLDHLGIPVFVVHPLGLEGILESINQIGQATNREPAAQELVKRLEAREARVAARVRGLPRPKVFVVIWYQPVITVGKGAFVTDVITAAGGRSVTADIPQAWPQVSLERVPELAPDKLLLVRNAGEHSGPSLETLKAAGGWSSLNAVRDGHVIYIDDRLFHASPVIFDAMEDLARKLHPNAFRPQ